MDTENTRRAIINNKDKIEKALYDNKFNKTRKKPKQLNPYEILEVTENASEKEIKDSFRKLAKKYHPDKNNTKEAKSIFSQILSAYEFLKSNDFKPISKESDYNIIDYDNVMDIYKKYEKEGMFDGDYSDYKKGQFLWNSFRKKP